MSGRFGIARKLLASIAVVAIVAAALWYAFSPQMALERLMEPDAPTAALYDRASVRAGFAEQAKPSVDALPPPITKNVLLDALSHPRSVRLLATEPYGEWQFAAAEGLPDPIARVLEGESESTPYMPRLLETANKWDISRDGIAGFTAQAADRSADEVDRFGAGHLYRFERDGLGWSLVHIELSKPIQ